MPLNRKGLKRFYKEYHTYKELRRNFVSECHSCFDLEYHTYKELRLGTLLLQHQ